VVEKAGQEQLEEWRTELGAGAWVWREQASLSAAGYEWHVTDHLGSRTLVLGEDGQAAVGPAAGAKGLASSQPRGFTGHQPKLRERLR
jgi:hypothetical protein